MIYQKGRDLTILTPIVVQPSTPVDNLLMKSQCPFWDALKPFHI